MKRRLPHMVPLSRQAAALLEEVQPYSGDRFVFPARHDRGKPSDEHRLLDLVYELGYFGKATTHGIGRKSSSTLLNQMGFAADHIERQLAHAPANKIRGIYNHAEWHPERGAMLQA